MTRTQTATATSTDWWRQAVVYQIYPRSFADADRNGIGDLRGITSRVPYLRTLGIDAVWLSPFYPSALADGGYDVDDYRDVDLKIGTLDDFDHMVARLHAAGIRVIVDLVPNHTSDRHAWFQEALAAPRGSAARDRYIFRDGRGPNGDEPPADWISAFGGPAWTRVEDGQWYLHLFAAEQPDLNWRNPEVREDFLRTIRFWSDRGVDGFRVDVAHGLSKDLPDVLPSQAELDTIPVDGHHPIWDRDDVHDIYAEWRGVFNEYDPPRIAVAEAWVASDRVPPYASPDGLGQAFNFDLLSAPFEAETFTDIVTFNLGLATASGSSSTWVLSNHDVVRHATRYGLPPEPPRPDPGALPAESDSTQKTGTAWLLSRGRSPLLDEARGLRRARAATLFILALPGSAYLYQGEELGLHEVADIDDEDRQDPTFFNSAGASVGRDGCRVPLPWDTTGASFGFGGPAHIPQPEWFEDVAVSVQEDDSDSTLTLYRRALALRRGLQGPEELEWIETGHPDLVAFARPGSWLNVTNFGSAEIDLPGELQGELLLSSGTRMRGQRERIPAETTFWLRTEH